MSWDSVSRTFGVNINSQDLCLLWDAELFRGPLKTVRNFGGPAGFDHLSGTNVTPDHCDAPASTGTSAVLLS